MTRRENRMRGQTLIFVLEAKKISLILTVRRLKL